MSVAQMAPDVKERTMASLAESLDGEARLLEQLGEVLRDQREGVGEDDVEKVDDSVQAAHRIMQTLGEARRRRETLVHMLTDRRDVQLSALPEVLGSQITEELAQCRDQLDTVARRVSAEVMLTRTVLTEAIELNGRYVKRLLGQAPRGYGGSGEANDGGSSPALINRKV
jgi:flagellar biosynthesis/type III secretory pathway chaperone